MAGFFKEVSIRTLELIAGFLVALTTAQQAFALDPNKNLDQFGHTTWTKETGAPTNIQALAQTADGYLWIGAKTGIYRFDGVTFEELTASNASPPQSAGITALLAAKNGDLWVGHLWGGLSVVHDGRLRNVNPARPNGIVFRIVQTRDDAIWAATNGIRFAGLRRYLNGKWTIINAGEHGLPKVELSDVLAARDGTLWVALVDRIVRLKPGGQDFESVDDEVHLAFALSEDADGRIWVLDALGARPLTGIPGKTIPRPQIGVRPQIENAFIRDRQGELWAANERLGLLRIRDPRSIPLGAVSNLVNRPPPKEDFTSGFPDALLEDREGNLWVGTNRGLDRFRIVDVVTEAKSSSTGSIGSSYIILLPTKTGDFYAMWDFNRDRTSPKAAQLYLSQNNKWQDLSHLAGRPSAACLAQDSGLWVMDGSRLHHLQRDRIDRTISLPQQAQHLSNVVCLQDGFGQLWVSSIGGGLIRFDGHTWARFDVAPDLAGIWPYSWNTDSNGRVLMYFGTRSLYRIDRDRVETLLTASKVTVRLIGMIQSVGNRILLGGERGIMVSDDAGLTFNTLSADRFSFLRDVATVIQSSSGDLWTHTAAGLVQLNGREVNRALANASATLVPHIFDYHDGLVGDVGIAATGMLEGKDGRIWLTTTDALAWIDPKHLRHNDRPPTVLIQSVISDGQERSSGGPLALPAGTNQLQIAYTATSLTAPEKVEFRYRMDGVDTDWVDAGTRRRAFYTNLGSGKYRFRVIAANEDGVWNADGVSLALEIPPTFIQSRAFIWLCGAAVVAALWLLYRTRMSQLSARLRLRHEERTAERERIARELHDTLLQSVQGLIFRFQSVAASIPEAQAARDSMEQALDRADEVVAEARDSVAQLRRPKVEGSLSQALQAAMERILANAGIEGHLTVEGRPRELSILVCEELVSIANEFLINTVKHSRARQLHIAMSYGRKMLTLRLRDDGRGIDAGTIECGGRDGHFGLPGMHERARRIGAEFMLSSQPGAGVAVSIIVPAKSAYRPSSNWISTLLNGVGGRAND